MKARTSAGRERGKLLQRRRAAKVLGEEGEKLQNVAPVGLERLRRHAAFGAKMAEPALDLGGDLGRYERRQLLSRA